MRAHHSICAYTDGVIDQMVTRALAMKLPQKNREKGDQYPFMPSMSALGMLTAGDKRLLPKIQAYAHRLCIDEKTGEPITFDVSSEGKRVWNNPLSPKNSTKLRPPRPFRQKKIPSSHLRSPPEAPAEIFW